MYKYDVAISFAGEDRAFVKKIAEGLSKNNIEIYFSDWDSVGLVGENLNTKFAQIYRKEALFTIPVFSKYYCEKDWTRYEFEHMQERLKKKDTYILPITIDGNIPFEYPSGRGVLDVTKYSIDEIVYILSEKIVREKNKRGEKIISPKKMILEKEDGTEEEVEVVVAFELKENKNEYVVYSKGERDHLGHILTYASKVVRDKGGNNPTLIGIENEDEWRNVKDILKEMAKKDEEEYIGEYTIDGMDTF